MRPNHAAVILILLLAGLFLTNLQQTSAATTSGFTAQVARTLWTTPYYAQVRDTVLINNTSAGPVSYFDFKITSQEYSRLFSMGALDESGRGLQVALQGAPLERFTFYRVTLRDPVPVNQTGFVTIDEYLLFYGSEFSQFGSNTSLVVTISPTILLLNPIFKANFTAFLPPDAREEFTFSPTSYTLSNVTFNLTKDRSAKTIRGNLTNIPQPDTLQPITINFSKDPLTAQGTNNIYITSAQTTINLGDTITASTTFTIFNARGGNNVGSTQTLLFAMPSVVESPVSSSDFAGQIPRQPSTTPSGALLNVTVPLRYNMQPKETYTLTLNYQLKTGSILQRNGDSYTVNLANVSIYLPFIITHRVRLVAPFGSNSLRAIESSTGQPPSAKGNQGGSEYAEFTFVNSTAFAARSIQASFNYAWFWGFIKPWFYTSFIYLIGLLFVAVYLRQKPVTVPTAPAIIEDSKKFCDLHDDKAALGMELQRLEDALQRGKIAKPFFDKRVSEIESSRGILDRRLGELSRVIRQSAPRYAKSLDQIELLEAELRTVTATVKDLQRQYAARRVSRRVYDDLMYTYEGRVRKIQGRIDSIIISLREGR